MAVFVCVNVEALRDQPFRMEADSVTFGRAPENDWVIPDESVSSAHGRLVRHAGGIRVEDLGSTNGTRVNDEEIEQADLHAGDRLEIGNLVFEVVGDDVPARPEPEPESEAVPSPEPAAPRDLLPFRRGKPPPSTRHGAPPPADSESPPAPSTPERADGLSVRGSANVNLTESRPVWTALGLAAVVLATLAVAWYLKVVI